MNSEQDSYIFGQIILTSCYQKESVVLEANNSGKQWAICSFLNEPLLYLPLCQILTRNRAVIKKLKYKYSREKHRENNILQFIKFTKPQKENGKNWHIIKV